MQAHVRPAETGLGAAVFDLSRGRQALLSVAQPALGAILALGGLPSLERIVIGLVAATTGYLAVFSLNDLLDHEVDERALAQGKAESEGFDLDTAFLRHPIAAGRLSWLAAASWIAALALVSAVCAWVLAPACLLLFAVAVLLEVLYCSLRSVTWTKTFISGLMVGVGGLAGWVAVAPLSPGAGVFFGFLALWEIAGRNLPNDLADLGPDRAVGIRTVATTFGPVVSSRATFVGAVATLASIVVLPASPGVRLAGLVAGLAVMGWPAVRLLRRPTSAEAGSYFNRASLLPALVFVAAVAGVLVGA